MVVLNVNANTHRHGQNTHPYTFAHIIHLKHALISYSSTTIAHIHSHTSKYEEEEEENTHL